MYWIPIVILTIALLVFELFRTRDWLRAIGLSVLASLLMGAVIWIDFKVQTADTEIWSGRLVDWSHDEEWDEWHPPVTSCTTTNGVQSCTTTPGYYEHHPAENRIKTTDNGWIHVNQALDGTQFNDSFPNDIGPLKKYFPLHMATASMHTYENRIQASYSIYRHKEINLENYPRLPEYPTSYNYVHVDRILGDVPNKQKALEKLAEWNAELNKMVPNPEKPGKSKSYKEVNVIFANLGGKATEDYGFALQDYWEGGNKNDFVVAFSMDSQGNVKWVYPFSWSDSELLKVHVRDYMLNLKDVTDFTKVVDGVSLMVEKEFTRKQFAEFSYLSIEVSTTAHTIIWILSAIIFGVNVYAAFNSSLTASRNKKYYY